MTTLNSNGDKNNFFVLFLILERRLSMFAHGMCISSRLVINGFYHVEMKTFWTYFLQGFNQEWVLHFITGFFWTYLNDHVALGLDSMKMRNFVFVFIEPSLYSGAETCLVGCMIFLIICCIWFTSVLKIFASMFIKQIVL